MYSFETLHPDREFINGKSVAYWLGTLRQDLPAKLRAPKALASAMSFHFDIEGQAWDEEHLRSTPELLFEVFAPIAPVTLAEAWAPFPYACAALGAPLEAAIDETSGWDRPAFAIFRKPDALACPYPRGIHEKHFRRLLNLVAGVEDKGDRILLVAKPGWSYRSCPRMSAHVKTIMQFVGYRYLERRTWPWWRF